MKKRVLVSMMVLAMAATAMVGCGKKDKETEAPVATEATTEAKETEAAADVYKRQAKTSLSDAGGR